MSDKTILPSWNKLEKLKSLKNGYLPLKHINKNASSAALHYSSVTITRAFWIVTLYVMKNGSCMIMGNALHNGWTQEIRPKTSSSESWLTKSTEKYLVDQCRYHLLQFSKIWPNCEITFIFVYVLVLSAIANHDRKATIKASQSTEHNCFSPVLLQDNVRPHTA